MTKLENKKAIITGGNRGIGKAIALAYAAEGASVVISYCSHREEAESVVRDICAMGGKALAIQADISNREERARLVSGAREFLGEINILVNNAGIYSRKDFVDLSEELYDQTMQVNVKGAFFLTQLVCRQMIEQKKGGNIINISSFRDKTVTTGLSHYQSSKAALTIFSKSIALELAGHNIRVNTISPGMIKTDIHRETWEKKPEEWQDRINSVPLKRAGMPDDIAKLAVYLASDDSGYATASRFLIDGGRSLHFSPPRSKL
jgi:NAD(P)-dependent dehydrogenase (short-subunit alcohol dehydrogenase family)